MKVRVWKTRKVKKESLKMRVMTVLKPGYHFTLNPSALMHEAEVLAMGA